MNVTNLLLQDDDPGSWEENFKSHHDAKPNGPEAIALDFAFPQAQLLFGNCRMKLLCETSTLTNLNFRNS